jgi:ADP-ribose diphosphatase
MAPPLPKPRMTKWSLTSTSVVGDYGIFKVLRHGVRDGAGNPRRDVVTLTCGDWCNVVAVTPEDELVLVWQYRFGTDALSLEVPGGVIDPGESPEAAARRELLEETGYAADSLDLLVVVEPNPAIQGNRCWTYLARGATKVAEPSFDELEELEVALVPTDDAARLLDEGLVTHALVHAALEAYIRKSKRA